MNTQHISVLDPTMNGGAGGYRVLRTTDLSGGGGGGSGADRELRSVEYTATAAGTGYSIGDILERSDMLDVTVAPPTILSTFWFNETTGAAISMPAGADITPVHAAMLALLQTIATNTESVVVV